MTDQDYIRALLQNDNDVMGEMYEKYRESFAKWIQGYVFKGSLLEDEIADIYMEAFEAVWTNVKKGRLNTGNLRSSLKTYLFSVGYNKARNLLRSKRIEIREISMDLTELAMEISDAVPKEDIERERIVQETVNEMKEPCNQLLNLVYYQKKTGDEIACIMGYKNSESVKAQKYKCMLKIKDILKRKLHY